MVTQAPARSRVLIAAAFVLSCLGLMIFTWTQFGGQIPFAPEGYRIHAGDIVLMHFRPAFLKDVLAALIAMHDAGLTPALLENYLA